ncbi:MAG: dihydroorotate dehydrogenase electron transfer subunit [Candidatus Altiarchaeota archaeon]|nr:dihydroorotate dehydrogenase electron transfer subunit [Candidatus Altiarchaeota archaeon]
MDAPDVVKVLDVRRETPTVNTLVLEKEADSDYGQFYMIWLPGVGEKPYACSRFCGNMELSVKKTGPFSEKLAGLRDGDLVGVRGPYGKGRFSIEGANPCFISGGIGIVPLIPLIERLKGSGKSLTVITGAKTKEELLFIDRIKEAGADIHVATDDGSAGEKCFSHQLFEKILKTKSFDQILCCGPEIMMREVMDIALREKIRCQLSLERYMKCGIGVCGSCALDPSGLLVCRDGPVFDATALIDTEFGRYKRDAAGSRMKL